MAASAGERSGHNRSMAARSAACQVMEQDPGCDRDIERARPGPHGDGDGSPAPREPLRLNATVLVAKDQGESSRAGYGLEGQCRWLGHGRPEFDVGARRELIRELL